MALSAIELKKVRVELIRVQAAKMELELRVDERMEEISRLKENIDIQTKKEEELSAKIAENK